ncbi:hypothetical protein G7046_g3910 [Stylonectria norvegica]|nr:hypothetical protein G7046_g3910 [Stylonectria norvegica]
MSLNKENPPSKGPDGSAALESHLRGLILSNKPAREASAAVAPKPSLQPAASIAPLDSSQAAGTLKQLPDNDGSGDTMPKQGSQPSKPARKRPNQAQRRQINAQFSIPIDPRPQAAPLPKTHFSSAGQQPQASPPHQRQAPSNSRSWGMHQASRSSGSYANNTWNTSPRNHGSYAPNQAPPGIYHPREPSGFQPSPTSPPSSRNGTGFLYNHRRPQLFTPEDVAAQVAMLDRLCFHVVSNSEIERSEIAEKEAFRCRIEAISRDIIARYEQEQAPGRNFSPLSVELRCFGSLSSGFATKASDMDLGLISPLSETQPDAPGCAIPRLLEKALLDAGLGARLLTRTRVPIIKLCEKPPEKLQQDLLTERYRWENGLDTELRDDDDQEQGASSHSHEADQGDLKPTELEASSLISFTIPSENPGEPLRLQLGQGPKHSLSAYYGLAKRILRRAGGRDVTMSNLRDFTNEDWDILNRVCQAFVAGLIDPKLRQRLGQYPSLSSQPPYNMPNNRCLGAVFTQVEGEHVLQLLETRDIKEHSQTRQLQAEQAINAWREVQYKRNFGTDPILYARELQLAFDRIKRLPTVQFICLEQGQHETPVDYLARTMTILGNLKPPGADPTPALQKAAIMQYISGIYQDEVRQAVRDAINATGKTIPLEAVARKHQSLHLAWEFERALEKDLYGHAHAEDIKAYVELLRSPEAHANDATTPEASRNFTIPLSPTSSALLARIRALPDPHKMAPNQPRDRYRDKLEFPKVGAGVQCDINFSAHLALQNTLLLRCYAHTDARVRPMVLFVKHWAKVRGINSGYRGTLSSYGYVLMVLHYLVNVAQPFVCPNLQQLVPRPPPNQSSALAESSSLCKGRNVAFWRNEEEILQLSRANQLNHNGETIGYLLRGFFEYYAQSGSMSNTSARGFDWGRYVLSLRTPGGLLTKQEKGWTGAKTVLEVQNAIPPAPPQVNQATLQPVNATNAAAVENDAQRKPVTAAIKVGGEVKEVRHRYLFAIEDPFELDHNVARTVTHNGIVSIRDEFRRAWRIIGKTAGNGDIPEDLLRDVTEVDETSSSSYARLLDSIHGLGCV